jgi:hypothetical protein
MTENFVEVLFLSPPVKCELLETTSSSSYALQLWESFGLLNDDLPFGAILDMF